MPADALADFAQTEERHESDDNADGADDADNPVHEQFLPESTGAMCARNTGHVLQGQLSPSAAWASVRWRAQLRRTFPDAASLDNVKALVSEALTVAILGSRVSPFAMPGGHCVLGGGAGDNGVAIATSSIIGLEAGVYPPQARLQLANMLPTCFGSAVCNVLWCCAPTPPQSSRGAGKRGRDSRQPADCGCWNPVGTA